MQLRPIRRIGLATALTALVLVGCGEASSDRPEADDPAPPTTSGPTTPTETPTPTPMPTPTSSAPAGDTLSEANLLTDADTEFHEGGDWVTRRTVGDEGPTPSSPCGRRPMSALGAELVHRRDFDFVSVHPEVPLDPTLRLTEVVAEFPSPAAARAAYDEVARWHDDCLPVGADRWTPGPDLAQDLAGSDAAQVLNATYGPVPEERDPYGDEVFFLETGLVRVGDRLAVLTQVVPGQDYNWPEGRGTPVERMLPAVVARLAGGGH